MAYVIAALIVVGAGSFYGGMKYQSSITPAVSPRAGGAMGANGGRGFRGMGGANGGAFFNGDVLSTDGNSLTLKLGNGGSKIVLYTTSTRVGKIASGSMTDLTPGTSVSVNGTANADGSVTADMIQIRPAPVATSTRP